MIEDAHEVAFDWIGTLVSNKGNHHLTYDMLAVLVKELPKFNRNIKMAYNNHDDQSLMYYLDMVKESSMYCPMPKLEAYVSKMLKALQNDKTSWPTYEEMDYLASLIGNVEMAIEDIIGHNNAKQVLL